MATSARRSRLSSTQRRAQGRAVSGNVREAWNRAFRKALKDYGSRSQAERIAWAAIDQRKKRA